MLLIMHHILQLLSMLFAIVCVLHSQGLFDVVIGYTKSNWESVVAWSHSVFAISPETSSIERLDIGSVYTTHVGDSQATAIARNVGVSTRTILFINDPLGSFRRMKVRLLKWICATMAVVSRMCNKRHTTKVITVPLIWVMRPHIRHLKKHSRVVMRRKSVSRNLITKCKLIVWGATVNPALHLLLY